MISNLLLYLGGFGWEDVYSVMSVRSLFRVDVTNFSVFPSLSVFIVFIHNLHYKAVWGMPNLRDGTASHPVN